MTELEYRLKPGLNKSSLWNMQRSPAHYQYYLDHEREDTQAYKFGRAVHSAILTPSAFKRDYAVVPAGIDRRTKAGKEEYAAFERATVGKEIITAEDAETIRAMRAAFKKEKEATSLLAGTTREKPIFWTDDNKIRCKCRVDAMRNGLMIDLKTSQDARTEVFTREALRYGYDVQAAHYIDGYQHKIYSVMPEWYFIVIEKTEPYVINILKADIGFIDHGISLRQRLIDQLISCQRDDRFPGYGKNDLFLPSWAADEI